MKKSFVLKIFGLIVSMAIICSMCVMPCTQIAAAADDIVVTYDYGDSSNSAFNDGDTLSVVDGNVVLPANSNILNLKWENGGKAYEPGQTVAISKLAANADGNIEFKAYYGAVSIDFEKFEDGFLYAANSVMDGSPEASIDEVDGNKSIVVNNRASDGNAVLFDYNENGEKAYVRYNLGDTYTVTLKYKNICTPEDMWNSISVGFGVAKNNKWEATLGKNNGLIAGKSNIVPTEEWKDWSATVTAPATYAWNTAGNSNKGGSTPTYATSDLSRHMAIGFAGLSAEEYLYIDEVTVTPARTLADPDDVFVTFDYGDSDNSAFNDRVDVIAKDEVILPNDDKILNLKWENGGKAYEPGQTVAVSKLAANEDGSIEFKAYYGAVSIDFEKFEDGFLYAANSVMDGSPEASVGEVDGNKSIVVNNRASDGNAVLFDYNENGEKAYVRYNLGDTYTVTLKYKNICTPEDMWNSLNVGFGVAKNNKWEATLGKNNGLIAGKSNIVPTEEWTNWSATVTAPATYAWNTAGNSNKGGSTPTYATSDLSRHMAIGFAGLTAEEYLYIDEVTVTPARVLADANEVLVSFDYGDSDNAAFNDAYSTLVGGKTVTLPADDKVLNLQWKNGSKIYDAGATVHISELETLANGNIEFEAYYGAVSIDFESFEDGFLYAANGVMDGSVEASVGEVDGNKSIVVNNRAQDGNAVLFDYNENGDKAYVRYNLGQKYLVTLKYKNICTPEDMWNNISVGFGVAKNNKWEATIGKNNGRIAGKSNIVPTENWTSWTAVVTAPDTYAWNTAANSNTGGTPTYATSDLSRHMAIGFSGLTAEEYLYIDEVVVIPYETDAVSGDVNKDNTLNILDLIRLKKTAATYTDMTAAIIRADVNMDGIINATDLSEIRKLLLG